MIFSIFALIFYGTNAIENSPEVIQLYFSLVFATKYFTLEGITGTFHPCAAKKKLKKTGAYWVNKEIRISWLVGQFVQLVEFRL